MDTIQIVDLKAESRKWLQYLFDNLKPSQRDWIGLYWKETYLLPNSSSEDLVVGEFIGPETPHKRITPGNGLCSLAVEKAQTVNEPNVKSNTLFLACSTNTESEIVIPLMNSKGLIVGELDIDSNIQNAFDSQTQKWLEEECEKFGKRLP